MTTDERSIERALEQMTPAEKIGQMTQASNTAVTPADVNELAIGSVLSGGNGNPEPNSPQAWVDMVGAFVDAAASTRLGIPLLYGVDAVHGHSNVRGATVFPHNIGLGAAGDADLVSRIGRATATEMLATGVHWTFAPTVAVPQDIRWGRTYEGYGRDPELVSTLGAAFVGGLQGPGEAPTGALACAKHFVGDGATSWGTAPRLEWVHWWDGWGDAWQIDQGDTRISESEMRSIHLAPYRAAVDAGVWTVMASYSSWNGAKLHGHQYLLTDVLKEELGFRGFVVSDWMGIDQLAPDYEDCVVAAVNAGVDMVMVPDEYRRFIDAMARATASGRISMARVDDAVRRILRAKTAAGLFARDGEAPSLGVVGSAEHRALAGEAVRRSAVMLKNDSALPIGGTVRTVDVAGRAADDVGLQCGGWTVGWQGGSGSTTPGSTLLEGLRSSAPADVRFDAAGHFGGLDPADVGIVCIAEPPYAEGPGDTAIPAPSAEDRAVFARMRDRVDTLILVIYSGRPLVMSDLIARADAVVAAWLPGTEGAALADPLVGAHPFRAHTPQPWPRSSGDLGDLGAEPLHEVGGGLRSHLGAAPTATSATEAT